MKDKKLLLLNFIWSFLFVFRAYSFYYYWIINVTFIMKEYKFISRLKMWFSSHRSGAIRPQWPFRKINMFRSFLRHTHASLFQDFTATIIKTETSIKNAMKSRHNISRILGTYVFERWIKNMDVIQSNIIFFMTVRE